MTKVCKSFETLIQRMSLFSVLAIGSLLAITSANPVYSQETTTVPKITFSELEQAKFNASMARSQAIPDNPYATQMQKQQEGLADALGSFAVQTAQKPEGKCKDLTGEALSKCIEEAKKTAAAAAVKEGGPCYGLKGQKLTECLEKEKNTAVQNETSQGGKCAGLTGEELTKCLENVKTQTQINALNGIADYYKYAPCSTKEKKCSPFCYYEQLTDCTFCGLFRIVFNTASKIGKNAMNTFSRPTMTVVAIAFGIWIAVQILAFVSSIETRDFKDLASSLLQQGFIVALVFVLLSSGAASFFNLALNPIFTTGMNIAEAVIQPPTSAKAVSAQNEKLKNYMSQGGGKVNTKEMEAETKASVCSTSSSGIYGPEVGVLPQEMGGSIVCTMTLIQNRASKVQAVGSAFMCQSWEKAAWGIIPHMGYFLTGLLLKIAALLIIVVVPFMMLDAVLELAVAAALLPLAIGAFAFKSTRTYAKKVWETFLNSMFTFIFISLIALMITNALVVVIANSGVTLDDMIANTDFTFEIMIKEIGWFTVATLKIVMIMLLAWAMVGDAKDFAGQFSGSLSSTSIGSSVGTMAASFSKSAIKKAAAPTMNAAGEHLMRGAKAVGAMPTHMVRRAQMNMQAAKIKRQAGAGKTLENGSRVYQYGNKKLIEDADGKITLESTKSRSTRNWLLQKTGEKVTTRRQGKDFTVKTVATKRGDQTVYEDSFKYNSNLRRNLFDKKGRIDPEKLNQLLENAENSDPETAEAMRLAVAKEILKQAMPNMKHNLAYVRQEPKYENGELIGYTQYHPDGSKSEMRFARSEDSKRLSVDFAHIDAKGKGTRLTTDGVINRKQRFVTLDGKVDGAIDEDSLQSMYAYSAYYHDYQTRGLNSEIRKGLQDSMFSQEEQENALHYTARRDEYLGARMYEFKAQAE